MKPLTTREMRFKLETIKALADLEDRNRIDITSAMNTIRALVADRADNNYSVKLDRDPE